MKLGKSSKYLVLGLIVVFGLCLRLWQLEDNPPINRDELAIGYNGYSVLKTGKDEHGAGPYPLNFQSFGDYKLPGLIYSTIPFIKLLGLSVLAIRLPTMIMGTGLILITYFLMTALFKSPKLGLLAALLVATTPWHLHGSRSAYEPIAALTFNVLALTLLLIIKQRWLASFSFIFLALVSMFFYNSFIFLFIPLYIWTGLTVRKDLFSQHRIALISIGVLMCAAAVIVYGLFGKINTSRFQTTIFAFPENTSAEMANERHYLTKIHIPLPFTKVLTNSFTRIGYRFAGSYLSAFNPAYLFITGGNNAWHNLQTIRLGDFQLYDLILIMLAVYLVITRKTGKNQTAVKFLMGWLLIAALPNGLTVDTPNTNRLMDFHYVLTLIGTYGLYVILTHKKTSPWLKRVTVLIILGMTIYFLTLYFGIYPRSSRPAYQPGAADLIRALKPLESQYRQIFINDFYLAYIYFAFFRPIEPSALTAGAKWENDGLDGVVSFGNYQFVIKPRQMKQIQRALLLTNAPQEALIVEEAGVNDQLDKMVLVVRDQHGRPLWKAYTAPHIDTEEQLIKQELSQ
jgi:4-amino-4-deoxy-L-arabinose transferase-like glycosyltransferase